MSRSFYPGWTPSASEFRSAKLKLALNRSKLWTPIEDAVMVGVHIFPKRYLTGILKHK